MRIACIIATVVFLVVTSLQFNDYGQYGNADWWSWVIIYVVTAVMSAVSVKKPLPRWMVTAMAGFAFGGFVFRMQDDMGNFHFERFAGAWLYDETGTEMVQQTNEAGGLFIVFVWLVMLAIFRVSKAK